MGRLALRVVCLTACLGLLWVAEIGTPVPAQASITTCKKVTYTRMTGVGEGSLRSSVFSSSGALVSG
jgi:hypothetical protein